MSDIERVLGEDTREVLGDALHHVHHGGHPWSGCAYPDRVYSTFIPDFLTALESADHTIVRKGLVKKIETADPRGPDLREALKRARNDLLAYGRHNDGELIHRRTDPNHRPTGEPCRCGLDAALALASAALGEKPQSHRDEVAIAQALDKDSGR